MIARCGCRIVIVAGSCCQHFTTTTTTTPSLLLSSSSSLVTRMTSRRSTSTALSVLPTRSSRRLRGLPAQATSSLTASSREHLLPASFRIGTSQLLASTKQKHPQVQYNNHKRRSLHLNAAPTASLAGAQEENLHAVQGCVDATEPLLTAKKRRTSSSSKDLDCLPRIRETEILHTSNNTTPIKYVLGVDEAGRGPLAGPVVAAAVWLPIDIDGIVDSKKITKEECREALYEQIVACPDAQWAVAVVDAGKIDEINILQATLLGMRMSLQALMMNSDDDNNNKESEQKEESNVMEPLVFASEASVDRQGTYVVTYQSTKKDETETTAYNPKEQSLFDADTCYALIDGNRLPSDLPCGAETRVKGDGREYAIAAASILAKVTRDRLMHGYDKLYNVYGLAQHKGYPTSAHMAAVHAHGASPIHRRTFAPLKHWEFGADGKIIGDKKKVKEQPQAKRSKSTTTAETTQTESRSSGSSKRKSNTRE